MINQLDTHVVNFRSLGNVVSEGRSTLDRFYTVIEEIPKWFSKEAARGYQGGFTIAKRPRVETTLEQIFGKLGCAIHIHVRDVSL